MIVQKVKGLFANGDNRLVFHFDEDGEFGENLALLEDAGIKVVTVGSNFFDLKYRLEFEWMNEQVFLYHPYIKPDAKKLKKYALLDLLTANAELKLDPVSEFLEEYGLLENARQVVKHYLKHLKTKTNRKKLAKILSPEQFSEHKIKLGLIAISLGFSSVPDKNTCVAKWLVLALKPDEFEGVNNDIRDLGLEEEFLNWLNQLFGIKEQRLSLELATEIVEIIKYNVIAELIVKPAKEDNYAKVKMVRSSDLNRLGVFFKEWQSQSTLKEDIQVVFNALGAAIQVKNIINWYGVNGAFGYHTSEMITAVIESIYSNIATNPKAAKDTCTKWLRDERISEEVSNHISFVFHAAGVYSILQAYPSFKFNTPEKYISEYTSELYKVDFHYRKALIKFDAVRDGLEEFEPMAMKVFENLNEKYDRFLVELNVEWQKVLESIEFNFKDIDVPKQYNFYNDNLKDFDYKIAVIISDAFRYELAAELQTDLLTNSIDDLSIEPSLASIPSYTNLGMSNLLPNNGIEVAATEGELQFSIDGRSTVGLANRREILRKARPESAVIDYADVIKFDHATGRKYFKENGLVYIYHDWMDAIGDKRRTEHETFAASEKAVNDIKRLMQKLYGWNRVHVLVTADHGFLYNYKNIEEKNREKMPTTTGYCRDHVRFSIADKFDGEVDGYVAKMNLTTNVTTDLKIALPRAINRFRKQGNAGVQFVHGGASLQELITPVVKFYKQRKSDGQKVTFKRMDQVEKIASGSAKFIFIQDNPVSEEKRSLQLSVAIYSDKEELLSNEVLVNFNATSSNPKERVFEVLINLNAKGTTSSFGYLKAYDTSEKGKLNPLANDLIKISSLIEKDEF